MANEHYKHGDVETRDFASEVVKRVEFLLTRDECIDMFNIIKYAQRAGLKEGVDWHDDAEKVANYAVHFKFGKFKDQLDKFGLPIGLGLLEEKDGEQ